jgi:hypothetical protein
MDLFGPDLDLTLVSGIWRRIIGYMYWPEDEKARAAWIIKEYPCALASIDSKYLDDPDYASAHSITYEAFRRLGGWPVREESQEIGKRALALRTAGAILDIVRKTPTGGSVNRAVHVVRTTAKTYGLIENRTDIFEAWDSHRCVAHLGVARILCEMRDASDFNDPRRLGRFVATACDYQAFASSYRAQNQPHPLIPEGEVWSFPADLQTASERRWRLRQPLRPLPLDMLAACRSYRARKRRRTAGPK